MKEKKLNRITLLALLVGSYCNAQIGDFVVTTSKDTIYVDKVHLLEFEIKTKTGDKKKKYSFDEIISCYISKEDEYYERIPLEKKVVKAPDKYDYRRIENSYLEKYEYIKKYKFIERLTTGKVKLFAEVGEGGGGGYGSPGQAGYMPPTHTKDKNYYISIYDSKLESIINNGKLKLTKDVYELLKVYLYGNHEINAKLDTLFISKPIAKEKQIIDLVNEYNTWVKSTKY